MKSNLESNLKLKFIIPFQFEIQSTSSWPSVCLPAGWKHCSNVHRGAHTSFFFPAFHKRKKKKNKKKTGSSINVFWLYKQQKQLFPVLSIHCWNHTQVSSRRLRWQVCPSQCRWLELLEHANTCSGPKQATHATSSCSILVSASRAAQH